MKEGIISVQKICLKVKWQILSEVPTYFNSDLILFKTLLTLEGRLHQGSARPGGTSMCEAVVF